MGFPVGGDFLGLHTARVSQAAPSIELGVAVEDLLPESTPGHSQAIVFPGNRRKIGHNQNHPLGIFPLPQKGNQAGIGIMKVNPLESRAAEILLEKRPPRSGGTG